MLEIRGCLRVSAEWKWGARRAALQRSIEERKREGISKGFLTISIPFHGVMRYPLPNNLAVWVQTRPTNISSENNKTNATQHARDAKSRSLAALGMTRGKTK